MNSGQRELSKIFVLVLNNKTLEENWDETV